MSGYVEAGYVVVGISLAAYSTWIMGRSRSINRAVGLVRHDEASAGAAGRPAAGQGSRPLGGGRGRGPARDGEAADKERREWR